MVNNHLLWSYEKGKETMSCSTKHATSVSQTNGASGIVVDRSQNGPYSRYLSIRDTITDIANYFSPKKRDFYKDEQKVIEFELVSKKGKTLSLRVFAPANYVRVMAKGDITLISKMRLHQEKMENGWATISFHDSGWRDGLALSGLSEDDMQLTKIKTGKYPSIEASNDKQEDGDTDFIPEMEITDVDNQSRLKTIMNFTKALNHGKSFELSFTMTKFTNPEMPSYKGKDINFTFSYDENGKMIGGTQMDMSKRDGVKPITKIGETDYDTVILSLKLKDGQSFEMSHLRSN